MQRIALPLVFVLPLGAALAFAPPAQDGHPSLTSRVLATYEPSAPEGRTPAVMAAAANAFLDTLEGKLREEATLPLDHAERRNWTNVPPGADELGTRLGDLNEAQLRAACDLLATVLSEQGYAKARDIPLADDKLLRNGQPRRGFGAENYWLVLFGDPSATEEWGLQFDGHHVAINLTFSGDNVTMSPTFIGTQPAEFMRGEVRSAPMESFVLQGFELVNALNDDQRAAAVRSERRGRIAAGAGRDGFVPETTGLSLGGLDEAQRAVLMKLLREFVADLPAPYAERRMAALEAEIDQMALAWSGPTEAQSDVSWRVHGPTVIVEYACQDLGGDPLDHLHSIYRDPTNEYGAGF